MVDSESGGRGEPRIEILGETKLVGMRLEMTLAQNRTHELWRAFMPRRAEVKNRRGSGFVSMQVFAPGSGHPFAPSTKFEKWAAVEVTDHAEVPPGMETYLLRGGRYAVFHHRGPASAAPRTFRHIFQVWLPASPWTLDDREHFERLPADYRPDDPNAEEDVWIPVRSSSPLHGDGQVG